MMKLICASTAVLAIVIQGVNGQHGNHSQVPSCRFALDWSQEDVLRNADDFAWDMLYWEGKFHQDGVSYNAANGMTYDGTQLDWTTGERTKNHPFSAASKEALQLMVYARAIAGSKEAARFLSPDRPKDAATIAASILETKLQSYLHFNETYPGFGGFLPWMTTDTNNVSPTWDWVNRVPGLDNGELLWAVYGCIQALEKSCKQSHHRLAANWQQWFDYAKTNVVRVFYQGDGHVCAVTSIGNQSLPISDPKQTYKCESPSYLDDPYEGELFTNFIHLFSDLAQSEKNKILEVKKKKLVATEYSVGDVGPITVEQGYWFSAHELWKVLEMPYYDIDIVRRLYHNAERARTCNSVLKRVPGLFASVNNSTDPKTDEIISYISAAGIPSIATQTDQYLEVITPYGSWPLMMFDRAVGLAWWRKMASSKRMQNPYGSTESARVDGKLVSALVTWDSKITTVVSMLGGVSDLVRQKMKADGIYDEFIRITKAEYTRVFKDLKGEHIDLCLPDASVPDVGLTDFTLCQGT